MARTNGDLETADDVPVLEGRNLMKAYRQADAVEQVLDGVSLRVDRGRFLSIMGPSGSGKSTLLHLLGGLDTPDAGEVLLDGEPLASLADDQRTRLRRSHIGIVYQFFNLIPVLTVEENIALPAVIAGRSPASYRAKVDEMVELVGLGPHRHKQPAQLSGGQQQRAAIARALFIEPAVLLADEPTGNVDLRTGREILRLFDDAQREFGQTIVMVTHDPRIAGYGDEVLLLQNGTVASHLDVAASASAAARNTRDHEARGVAVLRWLESVDGGRDADGVERPVRRRASQTRRPRATSKRS